ncbi:hypothetical protein [Siphonobacter sp. SORGH_AS_1065]|uniref:hypothetical protein n=1 Tax=Siphonobacter sp. SORGH_AS_1065 TaxID=3041795 RepID=UPI00278B92F4|nr:hypothetical protein [Siphonobacter sp. SORGH_AS_1065]MDQ1086175.1 hypothetical protein [Siphonobacter sp. SORGH_AS_1065]
MSSNPINIKLSQDPISIKIHIPNTPQLTAGKVFQFNPDNSRWFSIGLFNNHPNNSNMKLLLGMPDKLNKTYFFINGIVFHFQDSTPSSFQVIIEIFQGQKSIYQISPQDGGSGMIKDTDIFYTFEFQLIIS